MANEFKPVPLVSPDGRDYTAQTPTEFNDLVYGHGYKPAKGTTETVVDKTTEAANKATDTKSSK